MAIDLEMTDLMAHRTSGEDKRLKAGGRPTTGDG
jgi:hypothetical protein